MTTTGGPANGSRRWLAALILTLALSGCGRGDERQREACERLLPAFESLPHSVEILGHEPGEAGQNEHTIEYRALDERGRTQTHWLFCRFAGSAFGSGRLQLTAVANDRQGMFSGTQLQMLKIWQRISEQRGPPPKPAPPRTTSFKPANPLYFLQQLVNAIVPCSTYALIAVGFTLVYGVIGRINFAFGDIATIGGTTAYLGLTLAAALGAGDAAGVWLAMSVAVVLIAASWGLASDRFVFRPLAGRDGQAALIAAIGLAIALREGLRLAIGSRDLWLKPTATTTRVLAGDGFAAVVISELQLAIALSAVSLCALLGFALRFSRFGRNYRACCDDRRMAELTGVDAGRTVGLAFAVAGALAGIAGVVVTVYYGSVSAYMGLILGFKALVAAIAGGLGSVAGAVVGGILIGVIEQVWSGYLPFGYRDLAIFGLLAVVLIFRPQGLLGRAIEPRP